MRSIRRLSWTAAAAAMVVLGGCASTAPVGVGGGAPGGGIKAQGQKDDCAKKPKQDCAIEVVVTDVGRYGCSVALPPDLKSVGVATKGTGGKRKVVWTLTVPSSTSSTYEFLDDVGVYPVGDTDPDDAQFDKPKNAGKRSFIWISKKDGVGTSMIEPVAYNFLVQRTTFLSGGGKIVRICNNSDPFIYNMD